MESIQIPQYVEANIFVQLGIEWLPADQKMELLDQFNDTVNKRVMVRIIQNLPEAQRDELASMEKATPEEKMQKLVECVPNFMEIVAEEVTVLKQELQLVGLSEDMKLA